MKNCLRYPIFNQLKNWGAKLRINILTAKSFLLVAADSQIRLLTCTHPLAPSLRARRGNKSTFDSIPARAGILLIPC
jgi:hypothetical protein